MTSVMRCRVRLFFVARIHCRARVSSKMTSMMRSEKFYVGVDARSPPLIYRSYVVCRTVEREYILYWPRNGRRQYWKVGSATLYYHRLYPVSYTHLRAHETDSYLVCRLLL